MESRGRKGIKRNINESQESNKYFDTKNSVETPKQKFAIKLRGYTIRKKNK